MSRFEKGGFTVSAMKMVKLTRSILEEHYAHLKEKPFFPSVLEFMSSTPVIIAILERENAVEGVRKMCGATDPKKAERGTIRADLAASTQENIIHASDSLETAEKEIKRFFRAEEIQSYSR